MEVTTSKHPNVFVCLLNALLTACTNCLIWRCAGNNLQSLGMAQLEIRENEEAAAEEMAAKKKGEASGDSHREEEIDTCESPVWIVGTVIFVSGSILNFVAFAFAPQSILASLEGIQVIVFVFAIIFSEMSPTFGFVGSTKKFVLPPSSLFFLLVCPVRNQRALRQVCAGVRDHAHDVRGDHGHHCGGVDHGALRVGGGNPRGRRERPLGTLGQPRVDHLLGVLRAGRRSAAVHSQELRRCRE